MNALKNNVTTQVLNSFMVSDLTYKCYQFDPNFTNLKEQKNNCARAYDSFKVLGNGSIEYLAPSKSMLKPDNFQLSICFTEECNYTCEHCGAHISLTNSQEHSCSDKYVEVVLKFIKAYKQAMRIQPDTVLLNLFGGEITVLPLEKLIHNTLKVIDATGVENIGCVQFITNLSRPIEYLHSYLSSIKAPVRMVASFHDSILTTNKARQGFMSKMLSIRTNGAFVNQRSSLTVHTTFDYRNQWLSVPLGVLSLMYPFNAANSPLLYAPSEENLNTRFAKGRFYGPVNFGLNRYLLRDNVVCNGSMAGVQITTRHGKVLIEPQCITGKEPYEDLPIRLHKDVNDITDEDLYKVCTAASTPLQCKLRVYCTPCSTTKACSLLTAEKYGIKYNTFTER